MGPPDNYDKSREAKFKAKTDLGKTHTHHHRKNPVFAPWPKFYGACRALTGQTFSGRWPNYFKTILNNIAIYFGATYVHDIWMTLKAEKEAFILQPDDPKDNATENNSYICQFECRNYIVRREKQKVGLKRLSPLLLS